MFTRNPRLQPGKFLNSGAKRLLQQNPRCSGLDATVALGLFMTQLGHEYRIFGALHNACLNTPHTPTWLV
jgi:hypothetical protein